MKAEQTQQTAVDEKELARLKRDYLPMWAERGRGATRGRGLPDGVPYRDYMKATPYCGGEHEDRADPVVCRLVDASIDELAGQRGMWHSRAALAVRYMSAGLPSVFRSGRLQAMAQAEVEDLADEAERRLVPIVKRRGLPL